jgi:hypothetical protein
MRRGLRIGRNPRFTLLSNWHLFDIGGLLMRWTGFVAALVVIGGLAAPSQAQSPTAPIDGNWGICQKLYTPSSSTQYIGAIVDSLGFGVNFNNGVVTATDAGNTFTLNLALGNGAAQNADFSYGGYTMPGIYQVQGNVLTFVLSFDGSRPTSFTNTSNYLLVVLAQTP